METGWSLEVLTDAYGQAVPVGQRRRVYLCAHCLHVPCACAEPPRTQTTQPQRLRVTKQAALAAITDGVPLAPEDTLGLIVARQKELGLRS
jgi:hypothetical protein